MPEKPFSSNQENGIWLACFLVSDYIGGGQQRAWLGGSQAAYYRASLDWTGERPSPNMVW